MSRDPETCTSAEEGAGVACTLRIVAMPSAVNVTPQTYRGPYHGLT
jgi:hypothetical protein